MFTYRSHPAYTAKFGRKLAGAVPAGERQGQETTFDVEQYLRYQGQKFLDRFDALSYVKLTRTMDSHDLGRGRAGGVRATVAQMGRSFAMRGAGILVVGVSSDILYPVSEQRELVEMLNSVPSGGGQRHAAYFEVTSNSGHDGFLLDSAIFAPTLRAFLDNAAALRIQTVTARL
jgi:homoserine O-acetyltransferase